MGPETFSTLYHTLILILMHVPEHSLHNSCCTALHFALAAYCIAFPLMHCICMPFCPTSLVTRCTEADPAQQSKSPVWSDREVLNPLFSPLSCSPPLPHLSLVTTCLPKLLAQPLTDVPTRYSYSYYLQKPLHSQTALT